MTDSGLLQTILAELSSAAKQSGISAESISLWSAGKLIGGSDKLKLAYCPVTCAAIAAYRKPKETTDAAVLRR